MRLAASRVLCVLGAALLCSCARELGHFSLLASQTLPRSPRTLQPKLQIQECLSSYLLVPTSFEPPMRKVERSLTAALANVPGSNVLSNVEVDMSLFMLPYGVYSRFCFIVRGDIGVLE